MTKFPLVFFSITALSLAACGSGENAPAQVLQLELGDTIALKETRTTTLTPTIHNSTAGISFHWQQLSGPALQLENTTSKVLTLTAPPLEEDANAIVHLSVSDQNGYTVSDTKHILLKANKLPVVIAQTSTLSEKAVNVLNVTATDPDGSIASFHWQQISGPTLPGSGHSSAQLSVNVPAVTKPTTVSFAITVTDNEGESVTVQQQYEITPTLEHFQLGGMLAAANMTGAELIAYTGGQSFRATADENAMYSVQVALDDDESNDFLLLRAVSAIRPGMDLWLMVPSLRDYNLTHPANITPFSTAVSALVVRANQNTVPRNRDALVAAEQQLSLDEVLLASALIAAYPQQQTVALPAGYSSVFSTLVNRYSFAEFAANMQRFQAALLDKATEQLTTQPWNQLPLVKADLQTGLRLFADAASDTVSSGGHFYRLASADTLQVADPYFSYQADWGVLAGTVQTNVRPDTVPVLYYSIEHPDLSLSDEQKVILRAHGIHQLEVNIKQAGEQLTRFTQGAVISLYQRRHYVWYSISPVIVGDEQLTFADTEIERYDFYWASSLYPDTLALTAEQIIGTWIMPVYRADSSSDNISFSQQTLQFDANQSGYSSVGDSFNWQLAADINGQTALLLTFSAGQTQLVRLLNPQGDHYRTDSFVFDNQGSWLAATAGTMQKQL